MSEDLSRKPGCPVICVTGPMAAGKNTAADLLAEQGWAVIDADKAAHQAVEIAKQQILARFSAEAAKHGVSLLNPDGSVNRRAVGKIVFSDPYLLKAQEEIIHPIVDHILKSFIEQHPYQPVALNATVLYKVETIKQCSAVLFITAPMLCRLIRVRRRDHMPFKQILDRFRSQKHIFSQYKKSNADIYKVVNIGSIRSLKRKINRLLASCLY